MHSVRSGPTVHVNREGPSQVSAGPSQQCSFNCPSVASIDLVPSVTATTSRSPSVTPSGKLTADQSSGGPSSSHISRESSSGRLESIIRCSPGYNNISDTAFQLMAASWRGGMEKSYSAAWKRFTSWCNLRNTNPLQPDITCILEYLTELFQSGLQYSTINSHRSALSATLVPMEGYSVGQHPLIP